MLSRFYLPKPLILLLWTIVYCASCAPLPQTCIRCALSCDDAHDELKKHQSAHVKVEHQSVPVVDGLCAVSTLLKDGRCSVVLPDCSNWDTDTLFTLQIYPDDDDKEVFEPFYEKNGLKLDCVSEGISDTRDDADRNLSNKLLILLLGLPLYLLLP